MFCPQWRSAGSPYPARFPKRAENRYNQSVKRTTTIVGRSGLADGRRKGGMEIVLYEPLIPGNTGNVSRLSAGLGMRLNLIEPLGFSLDDNRLKRAGLDYWPLVDLRVWPEWAAFRAAWKGGRIIAASARSGEHFSGYEAEEDDGLLFGCETRGLPDWLTDEADKVYNIPLRPGVRSLNMSTTAGFFMGVALARLWKGGVLPHKP
jgi:tRNA (cytidine/uridine-2'-O-)-methyltransferase